ncbi:MAG: flippase-like domain-containing protein [Bryobacteraceae bacterium]|nr:flippase-like domain-containing protein [Bryobacteraceae bacterium]
MQSRRIGLIVLIVVLVAAVAAGIARFSGSGFQWSEFGQSLASLHGGWATAAVVLNLITYLIRALRWQVMMTPIRPNASLRHLITATAIGFTAVLLFGRPGELVRPWLISVRERVTLSSQIAAWFLERIFDLLSVVLLFGISLAGLRSDLAVPAQIRDLLQAAGWLAVVAGAGCVLFLLVAALFTERARSGAAAIAGILPARIGGFVQRSLDAFLTGLQSTGDLRTLGAVLGWTAVEWILISGSMYSLLRAFPPTSGFSLNDTLVFTGFVVFGGIVQLPAIGGGLQAAAVLILTQLFGLGIEPATAFALLVWAVSWLAIAPFGLFFAFTEGLQWQNLRNISNQEAKAVEG